MRNCFLLTLISILYTGVYGQIKFEPGYIIDNSGQTIECQIKNLDWNSNPTQFEYRISVNDVTKIGTLESVREFGIGTITKYVRSTVDIDRSSEVLSQISHKKDPVFKEETLFLKVLVEGYAALLEYKDKNLVRYFYNKEGSKIEQLIFKSYEAEVNKVRKNNRFKNQLWLNLKCPSFNITEAENLDYTKDDLIAYFTKYHTCVNASYVSFEEKEKKDLFNLSFRPGINISNLSVQSDYSNSRNAEFDNELTFRFGIEAEVIFPFNKNKWALIIEPTYQYFKSEKANSGQVDIADYKSIELPFGIRHYMFLNTNSKLFVNGAIILDASSSKSLIKSQSELEINTTNNIALGLGYKLRDKYSIEFRYHTPRELLSSYAFYKSDYKTFSVIIGYSVF